MNVAIMSSDVFSPAVGQFTRDDPRLARLHDIIREKSLLVGDFTLSSGRKSSYLFQLRQTTMHPEGAALIGGIVIDFMKQQGLRCVGGLELGAVPIVSTICPMSFLRGYTIDTFFVRKKAKEHGAKELIDGYIASRSEILLIDDVTTTGGSVLKAIDVVRSEHNCTVTQVLSIVDREEGATENLADNGIKLTSLFKRSDFQIG